MPGRPLFIALAALGLAACNSVSATIESESTEGVKSAFFVEDDGHYGSHGLIQVYLVSVEDGCTTYGDFYDELNDMDWWGNWDALDDVEDLWADYFPETFEETILTIRVDDTDDSVAGLDFKGVDWNDALTDDDETKGSLSRYKKLLDSDYWETWAFGGDRDDWVETWLTDDGEMSIAAHTPRESIRGSFDSTLVQADDGDTVDDISFRFSAAHCPDFEDELFR